MLEAIRERAQGWFAKIILALIAIPFALWGVDSYLKDAGNSVAVATVGDRDITRQEFDQELRQLREQGRNTDAPQLRQAVLTALVNRSLELQQVEKAGLRVPDALVGELIRGAPMFLDNGQFSNPRYQEWLRQQNLSAPVFERRFRDNLLVQQLMSGVLAGVGVSRTSVEGVIRANEERRAVSVVELSAEGFLPRVAVTPADARAYYDGHQEEFKVPEQARLSYVVLSRASLEAQVEVSEAELKKFYEDHAAKYATPEERRARHILLNLPEKAGEAEEKAVRAKAEALVKDVRATPAKFAELAKQNSQDPGSAAQGGDLGFFPRGGMVKAFDDAVFAMKPGEVSEPVRSPFGYHIIRLEAVKPATTKPFEAVRGELAMEVKRDKAGRQFAEAADAFGNLVYEQSDSLKPAADAYKLPILKSDWVARDGKVPPPLGHPKLIEAVFIEDVLKNGRNSEAVEVAPGVMVAARVEEYQPASIQPFERVAAALTEQLRRQKAREMAIKQGQAWLAELAQGKAVSELRWGASQDVSRLDHGTLKGEKLLAAIFRASTEKFPSYAGAETAGGFTLAKVEGVKAAPVADDAKRQAYLAQVRTLLARELRSAYYQSLKDRMGVTIKQEEVQKVEKD